MTERTFVCQAAVGDACEGELLVSRQGFNARYDLDLATGIFSRPEHDLYGQALAGKVLVFRAPKGGIATSWALDALAHRGLAPRAILCQSSNPVVVQGAVLANIALMSGLPPELVDALRTGRRVRLDPQQHTVTLASADSATSMP